MSVVIRFLQHYPSEVVGEGYWCTLSQLRCIACFSVGQMNNTTFLARNQILPLIAQGQYTEVFHEKPKQNPVEQSDQIQLQQFRKQVVYVTPYTKMPAGRYVVDEQEHFIDILREDGTVYRLCKKGKVSLNEQKSDVKMNDILSIAAKEIMTNVAEDSETLQDRNVNPNTNISSNVSLDAQGSSENGHVNAERNQMTDSVEPVQTPNSPPQTPSRVSSQIQQSTHQKQNSEQYSTLSKEPELLSMPNGFFESVPQVTKQKKHFLSTSKVGKPPIKAKETNPDVIVIQNECGATYECTPLGLVEELEKHGYCFSSNSPEKKQQVFSPQESSQQSVSRPTSTCPSFDSGISEGMELAPSAGYSEPTLTAEESQTALAIEAHADFLVQNSQEDIDKQDQGQSTPDAVEKQVFLMDQNRETSVQKDLDKMNEKSGFEQDNSLSTSEKFSGESSMAENPETFPPGDGTIHSPDTSLSFQGIPSPNSEVSTELKGGKEKTDNLSILASVAEEASPFSVETEVDESVETACSEMNSENEPLSRAAVEITKSKQVGSSVTATVISVSDSVIVEPVNQFETEKFEHFERNMDCSNELQSEEPTSGYLQEQSLENVKTNVESVSLPVQEAPCREITNDHEIENLEELRSICVELDQPKVQTALPLEKDLESEEAVRSSMDKPREILDESVHQEKLSAAGEAVRSIMDKPNKIPDMVVDQENLSATEGAAGTLPDHDLSLSASDDELPKMDSVNRNVKVSPDVMKKAWIKLTMDLSEHSSDEETELKANHETLGKAYSVEKNICYESVPTGCDNVLEGTENVETYSPNANILPQREVSLTENFAMKSQTSPIRKSSIEGIPRPEKTEDVKQRDKESENFDQLSLKLQNMITKQKENNVKRNVELKVTSIEDSLVDSDSDNSEHKTCAEKDESKAEVTVPSIEDSFVDLDIDNSKHKRCKKKGGSKRKRKKKTKDVKRKTSCQTKISSIKLTIHKGRCVSMVGKNSKTEPRDSETSPSEHDETLCRADQNQNPDMKSDITEQTSKKHHKTKKRKQGCSVDQFSKKQKISEDLLEKPLEVDLNMKLPESKEHVLDVSKTKKGSAIAEEQLQNSKDSQKSETEPLISGNRNDIETMDSENTSEVVRITELTETNVHDQTGSIKSKPIGLTAAGNDFDMAEASNGPIEVDFTSGRPEHALTQNTKDHDNEMGSEINTSSSGNTRLSEIAVTRDFTGSASERTVRTRDNAIEMTVTFDSLNTGHERSEGSKIIHERTTGISSWEGVKQSTNEMIGGTGTVKQHQEMKTSGRLESSESTTEGLQDLVEGDSSKAEGDSEKKWWTNLAPIHRMKGILERVVIQGVKESGGHLDLQLQVDPSIYQVFGEDEEKKRSLNDKLHQLSRIAYLQRRPELISKQGNASQGTPNVNNQKPCCSKGQQPLFSAQEANRIPCVGSSLDKINAVETDNSKSSFSSSVVKDTVSSSKRSKDSSTKSKAKDQSHSKKLKLNSCSSPSRKISLRPLHAESTSGSMDTTDKNGDYQTIKVTVLYDSDSSLKS